MKMISDWQKMWFSLPYLFLAGKSWKVNKYFTGIYYNGMIIGKGGAEKNEYPRL
ncbi:hypothetical protein HDF18_24505 [Mucilaginibacter sp. X5P1]|uniref:hypothetical protein n=1 Tax=Mucilaginibacter sp. X5P1 TaxID=2723088 RepID=UPI0017B490D0|nr:hypothetical protein [Mucilaginibacter sp. X5P1]